MTNDYGMCAFHNMKRYEHHHICLVRDVGLSAVWLLFLWSVNQKGGGPVVSIFPYLIPVVFITLGYGLIWGFVISAAATHGNIPGSSPAPGAP